MPKPNLLLQAYEELNNFKPTESNSHKELSFPRGGETIYFFNPTKKDDWLADGYGWVRKGSKPQLVDGVHTIRKEYFHLKTQDGSTDAFTKDAYRICINGNQTIETKPVKIVYTGNHDLYEPQPHGNSKDNEKHFTRTKPSAIQRAKLQLKESRKAPSQVYKESSSENELRNKHQVQNLKYSLNKEEKLTNCEIRNVFLMCREIPIVKKFTCFPNYRISIKLQIIIIIIQINK